MEERLQDLERRLAAAHRQLRVLIALGFGIPVVLAGVLLLRPADAAANPQVPGPKRTVMQAPFDVVDKDGNRLMTVEEKRGGGAQVWFYRADKKVNAILDCTAVGASFGLYTPDEKPGMILDAIRDGGTITLYNTVAGVSKEGVLIRASINQGTKLSLSDKDGEVLFTKP